MITVDPTVSSFRPPAQAREGGPTPENTRSPSPARSPEVEHEHLVHIYEDDARLAEVVGTFLADALVRGDGVALVATEERRAQIEERLAAAGMELRRAADRGRYVALEAACTLDSIMGGDLPAADRFDRVVGEQIRRLVAASGACAGSERWWDC